MGGSKEADSMTTMRKPAQPGARRRSQAKGAVWERCVSEWLKRLKAAGVLTAFHKLEPTKIGERFVKDAGADFVCCTSSGHYIAIECKATDKDRFKRSEVSQVQTAHLDAVPLSFLAGDSVGDVADCRERDGCEVGRVEDEHLDGG